MCALEGLNAWHVVLINSFLFTLSLFSVFVCLCLWFPLTVSLFLSSHSHPLSVSLLFFCTVSTSASVSCSRRSSTRPNISITCFPILRTLLLLPLQLDELFSKINPWQATKCNYTSTSISFPPSYLSLSLSQHTWPQSASASTLIIVNRQPIASQQLLPLDRVVPIRIPVPNASPNANPRTMPIRQASPRAGCNCQLACGFC